MMEIKFLKREFPSFTLHFPCFGKIHSGIHKDEHKSLPLLKKEFSDKEIFDNSEGTSFCKQKKKNPETYWYQYLLYIHIIILYFLLFSVYYELKRTRETMNEFHMSMINITMKGIEVEKNCLSEISNFKKSVKQNWDRRSKREIFLESGNLEKSFVSTDRPDEMKTNASTFLDSDMPRGRNPRKISIDGRGKKKYKRKNRRRRNHGFPKASHFIGAFPEPHIKDGGLLAPWLLDKDAIKDFSLMTKVPSRGREAVEIIHNGLYFIYAQVYYITSKLDMKTHNSFSIMLKPSSGVEVILAQCATHGDSTVGGDASCFTATAYSLTTGDLVYIKQRERDRNIVMKRGQTFLGLVLLNKK